MYEFASESGPWLAVLMLVFFFILVGQGVAYIVPTTPIIGIAFGIFTLAASLCGAYITIYDKGMEAARKDQEPDKDNRRDSTT